MLPSSVEESTEFPAGSTFADSATESPDELKEDIKGGDPEGYHVVGHPHNKWDPTDEYVLRVWEVIVKVTPSYN